MFNQTSGSTSSLVAFHIEKFEIQNRRSTSYLWDNHVLFSYTTHLIHLCRIGLKSVNVQNFRISDFSVIA